MDDEAERSAEALQIRNLRRIHSGLAHDLRSPFNAAFLQLELLKLTAARRDEKQVGRLEHLESELHRLRGLIEALVAQFDADGGRRNFDLSNVVREIADLTAAQADKEGVEVVVRTAAPLRVSARPDLVRSAIFGLVLRALDSFARSGADGGRLSLKTTQDGGDAQLEVSALPKGAGSEASDSPPAGLAQPADAAQPHVVREILQSQGAGLERAAVQDGFVWRLRMPLAPTD